MGGAAPPTPLTNRVDFRTEANAFGTCSSCPTCTNKMAHLEKAWGAYTADGAAANRDPIKPVIMLGSCGDKAQVYVTQTRVGRSGQHYTHAWAFTLYLEDDASTKEGFRIATVIAGHDTEMLMNMAEREQLSDTYTCSKIGNWSEAVTHTIMQP